MIHRDPKGRAKHTALRIDCDRTQPVFRTAGRIRRQQDERQPLQTIGIFPSICTHQSASWRAPNAISFAQSITLAPPAPMTSSI